jgi:hypothetical protein
LLLVLYLLFCSIDVGDLPLIVNSVL